MASVGLFEIILAVVLFIIYCCLSNNSGHPRKLPLVGMLPTLLLNVHRINEWCTEVLERNQGTFLFRGPWRSNMDILLTADPANVHYIMNTSFSNFPKGPEFKEMFDILGDGIFNADLDLWKNQRKVAQTLVTQRRFTQFLVKASQEKVERGLITVLEHVCKQGLVVDLQDLFRRFTFDSTCTIITGHDPGCLSVEFPDVAFSQAMDSALQAIFYRHVVPERIWKLQKKLQIGQEKKLNKAWETLDRFIGEVISAKRENLSRKTESREDGEAIDLLTSYMSEDHTEKSKSTDKFLRDVVINFMLAGRDTTSSALAWFFWLLSRNPQVEAKIREEIKSTLPTTESEKFCLFEIEKLKGLVYLHGALCEALRLYPPVPFEHKIPLKPDILPSGHHVNPDMKIVFSLYAMGRMTSIWGNDCLEFKPERWISERGGIKHEPSYKFLAFNAGPRTCLGKEIAFTQMKAVAAAILHNFQVQVLDDHAVVPSVSIILHMKHGMKVRLRKRWT